MTTDSLSAIVAELREWMSGGAHVSIRGLVPRLEALSRSGASQQAAPGAGGCERDAARYRHWREHPQFDSEVAQGDLKPHQVDLILDAMISGNYEGIEEALTPPQAGEGTGGNER